MLEQNGQESCMFAQCGKPFHKRKPWQKFCSRQCRDRHWSLQNPRLKTFLKNLKAEGSAGTPETGRG
jgi:hypothetical protein